MPDNVLLFLVGRGEEEGIEVYEFRLKLYVSRKGILRYKTRPFDLFSVLAALLLPGGGNS